MKPKYPQIPPIVESPSKASKNKYNASSFGYVPQSKRQQ